MIGRVPGCISKPVAGSEGGTSDRFDPGFTLSPLFFPPKKLHFLPTVPVNISAPGSHFPARLRCTANHRLVSAISQEDKQLQSVPSRASITHFQTPLTTPTSMIFSPPADCQWSSFDRLRLCHLESTWHDHNHTSSNKRI